MKVITVIFFMVLSLNLNAVENKPKNNKSTWKPQAFSLEINSLPKGYSGLDSKRFLSTLKQKIKDNGKDEFETTEEYKLRVENIEAMQPFDLDSLYAFQVENIGMLEYNADSETYYTSWLGGLFSCTERITNRDLLTCDISKIERKTTEYVGSNAYGADAIVTKTRGIDFGIAFSKSHNLNSMLVKSSYSERTYIFNEQIPTPLSKARTLKNKKLGLLIIGKLTALKVLSGNMYGKTPSINDPDDIIIDKELIPFNPTNLIFYVVDTGEVLRKIDL